MKSINLHYIVGGVFAILAIYQAVAGDWTECVLYGFAGTAFTINALAGEKRCERYRKVLVTVAWLLILTTALLFFFLLQFKHP